MRRHCWKSASSATNPPDSPTFPGAEGYEIRPAGSGPQTRLQTGRRLEYVFEYIVTSYQSGNHIIPSFEIPAVGNRFITEPIEFSVFDPDDLKWSEASAGGVTFRYATAFRVMNPTPFNGEATPVEIKLYVPRDFFVEDWGIPDFQRDGLTAWRMQPSAMRGSLNLLGMPYTSASYPSTLATNRVGKVSIGPAKVRLINTQVIMDGFLQRVNKEVFVNVEKLELDSLPLPDGAPEGFENAIGTFRMEVGTSVTDLQEGDPIPVEIAIRGSGNLDTIQPPKPVETDGWKIYGATNDQRDTERSELSGSTVFRQFMRPLELKSQLPSYKLVFLNPKTKTYETITSPPIPLNMKPANAAAAVVASAPPQSLAIPVERMTDILGLTNTSILTRSTGPQIPQFAWHLLGALLALILILKALWMRFGHKWKRDPILTARLRQLKTLESTSGGDLGFLMAAGAFIEGQLGTHPDPALRTILAERDEKCFRAASPGTSLISPQRRSEILQTLRRALTLLLFSFILIGSATPSNAAQSPATDARSSFDQGRFEEAAGIWLGAGGFEDLTADTLYNIGNACYRGGSPGHAALYYRRALTRDATHAEARQNLRFIERKYGAITIQRPDYQYALARIPLSTWQASVWTCAWLIGLSLLVFPATQSGSRLRIAAVAVLVVAPILGACGGLGWRYFPNDAQFAAVGKQAVVIPEKAVLFADASRTSPEVIDAPPGSLCEIIQESGRWSYVGFATKTRGWIPSESIERIQPKTPPNPPRFPKPKIDDKNA